MGYHRPVAAWTAGKRAERCCATCRHFAGVPLTCTCLGAPIPWADAIAPGGPCHGETAPRWEARLPRHV